MGIYIYNSNKINPIFSPSPLVANYFTCVISHCSSPVIFFVTYHHWQWQEQRCGCYAHVYTYLPQCKCKAYVICSMLLLQEPWDAHHFAKTYNWKFRRKNVYLINFGLIKRSLTNNIDITTSFYVYLLSIRYMAADYLPGNKKTSFLHKSGDLRGDPFLLCSLRVEDWGTERWKLFGPALNDWDAIGISSSRSAVKSRINDGFNGLQSMGSLTVTVLPKSDT